jgi:hypothetical protein
MAGSLLDRTVRITTQAIGQLRFAAFLLAGGASGRRAFKRRADLLLGRRGSLLMPAYAAETA